MTSRPHRRTRRRRAIAIALGPMALGLLLSPGAGYGHAGHGDEFSGQPAATGPAAVTVEAEVITRLGIRTEAVMRRSRPRGLVVTGQVEPLPGQAATVTAPVDGRILTILVAPGDRVTRGQPLAVMVSRELATLQTEARDREAEARAELRQAEVALSLARSQLARERTIAQATLNQARSQLATAQERHDRDRELTAAGALPRRQALATEDALMAARAAVAEAESQVNVLAASAAVDRAEADWQAARDRLGLSNQTYRTRLAQLATGADREGRVPLRAPIAGVVATVTASPGETVEVATKALFSLTNSARVAVTANLPEKDAGQVRAGQPVRVAIAALGPVQRTGTVTRLGTAVSAQSRVIPIQATVANGDGALKPGMFATVEIQTGAGDRAVLAVPERAIVEANGQRLIYVENGDRAGASQFQPVAVEPGEPFGGWVEIRRGLFEGDRVVVQGAPLLYGQSLRGGSAPASGDDHNHDHPEEGSLVQRGLAFVRQRLPGGLKLPAAIAIAGAFGLGYGLAKRSSNPASNPASDPASDRPAPPPAPSAPPAPSETPYTPPVLEPSEPRSPH